VNANRDESADQRGPDKLDDVRLAGSPWAGAWKKAAWVGVVGLALSAYGAKWDPLRFGYSYLFAFIVVLSIALGSLFFVLVQHLTSAGWSATVRRGSEFLMCGLPVFLILVVPVLLCTHNLYPWDGSPREIEPAQAGAFANAMDEGNLEPAALAAANRSVAPELARARDANDARVIAGRKAYMNRPFFALRALVFLALWSVIGLRLFRWSTRQDEDKRVEHTLRAKRFAPIATIAFSVALALAAFDWLMSLEPMWYSTIFGVYVFAGCTVGHAAVAILLAMVQQRAGLLRTSISVDHYHDLGKLLFGWLSFWAYIAFVQFFLIWYANIPEEVSFFHLRWTDNLGSWKPLSTSLFVLHFLLPFWVLLSRNAKRSPGLLGFGAVVILALHVVDVYWLVLPNVGPFAPDWLDVTCLLGIGGIYAASVLRSMEKHPLIALGDPRLARALSFENG
jgi:hypothetical protein